MNFSLIKFGLLLGLGLFQSSMIFAQSSFSKSTAVQGSVSKSTISKTEVDVVLPPTIKLDEYTYFINNKYEIFKTAELAGLKVNELCLKKGQANCLAFLALKNKMKPVVSKFPGATHYAAINCENLGGKNFIALDFKKDEFNFCRFPDESMVNSWDAFNYMMKKEKKR